MKSLRKSLKPDWRKLILFALFAAIAVGGKIQAWAFSDIPPKPPLYDLLRPFPIWPLWMFLLIPLALLAWPLRLVGLDLMGGPPWLFITSNVIYFYLLACFIVSAVDWLRAKWR
ncbi:MAG: hypothetical protein PVG32_20595 [Anaerolineales bacterium]|jgi:hypothetical protein